MKRREMLSAGLATGIGLLVTPAAAQVEAVLDHLKVRLGNRNVESFGLDGAWCLGHPGHRCLTYNSFAGRK